MLDGKRIRAMVSTDTRRLLRTKLVPTTSAISNPFGNVDESIASAAMTEEILGGQQHNDESDRSERKG